ncbi:hypothetical protein CR513_42394, partial [Mucuna pruriens]
MARFLSGLNKNIQDNVELHHYTFISMLVHQTSKVESQLIRKRNVVLKGHKDKASQVYVPNSNTHKSSNIKCVKRLGKAHIASYESSQDDVSKSDGYSSVETLLEGYLLMMIHKDKISLNLIAWLKFCFPIISHPNPYKLQWLNTKGNMLVDKQVLVELTLGKYKDEILCDVVPMEETHILLGRPW